MINLKQKEWDRYYEQASIMAPRAAQVLVKNQHLLPHQGRALDLACGLGGNALLLASKGLKTYAYDQSPPAIHALHARAEKEGLSLEAKTRDVENHPPEINSFDVIVVSYFLYRPLFPHLFAALRMGGLLFYQTFSGPRILDRGPKNPTFRLKSNELLSLCAALEVLVFQENNGTGNLSHGLREEALLVGRKR